MHNGIHKIREFFPTREFSLIKFQLFQYIQCMCVLSIVAMLYSYPRAISGGTSGSSDCEIYIRCNQTFQFPPRRDRADFVSSGRLREVKKWSFTRGGRLQEVPTV